MTRRAFARWTASAAAMLWSPLALAEDRTTAMFLRPGDPYSDPKMLRKRYDRGGVDIEGNTMAGKALAWRIVGDPFAAGFALGELLKSKGYASRLWYEVAEFAMTADWLSTYQRFTPAMKNYLGDCLLKNAEFTAGVSGFGEPASCSLHNIAVHELALCFFAFMGGARLAPANAKIGPLRVMLDLCLRNVMEQMQFVVPDGSYHESMDYMRHTYVPLAMISEMRRSLIGQDVAEQISTFANIGTSYVYKLLPDGTLSREGDCEFAFITGLDPMALGYAVHRFQDRYAAWMLQNTLDLPPWQMPVMRFLWDNPLLAGIDPSAAAAKDLKLAKHFRGVDQIVFRNGFGARNTRIEFDCGPYFAKHQHLDRNHFTIHHRGHLAIDSGADYKDSESPHYLNYYRRTVAHNTMLVYDPAEKFFWGDHLVDAANDGGQRMDSPRYWNTIRSVADWQATRELWDVGHLRNVEINDPRYMYAMGDATKAYSAAKLTKFTREMLFFPSHDVLFVYDDVQSTKPELRKTWLLHTVNEPDMGNDTQVAHAMEGATAAPARDGKVQTARVTEGDGEMLVHTFLPDRASVTKRGGAGDEFWTPGDAAGGEWGSGRNWPLDPAAESPLPADPEELALWRKLRGDNFKTVGASNHLHAVPGSWRIEVTPVDAVTDDVFFHAFEIGDKGKTGKTPVARIHAVGVEGALCGRMVALFVKAGHGQKSVQFQLPNEAMDAIWMRGLPANLEIAMEFFDGSVPVGKMGMPLRTETMRVNPRGMVMVAGVIPAGARVSLRAGAV